MVQRDVKASAPPAGARLTSVLESALSTFARNGYRRTSMDDVARDARISRPGLYLYFPSKQALLHAAVEHALSRDVAQAELVLADERTALTDRLLAALDLWAGQYVGPLATDLEGLLEQDASLLGELPTRYADRFGAALTRALLREQRARPEPSATAAQVAEVVLSLSVGTKRRADSREDFRARIRLGLGLLLR